MVIARFSCGLKLAVPAPCSDNLLSVLTLMSGLSAVSTASVCSHSAACKKVVFTPHRVNINLSTVYKIIAINYHMLLMYNKTVVDMY